MLQKDIVQFQGVRASKAVQERCLSREELEGLVQVDLDKDNDPYVRVPTNLQILPDPENAEALQFLDRLALEIQDIRKAKKTRSWSNLAENKKLASRLQPTALGFSNKPWAVEYVGSGGNSDIFKVTLGDKYYAFRVGSELHEMFPKTIANHAYLTAIVTRNMNYFYIANPVHKWILCELIDENTDTENRPGVSLRGHGFYFADGDDPANLVRDINVDPDMLMEIPDRYDMRRPGLFKFYKC